MTTRMMLNVKNNDTLDTVRDFLKSLLELRVVEMLLVPLEVPTADRVTPILVQDPQDLNTANPLAPVMRVNTAAVIARLQRGDGAHRIGAVLRPCELRATIELAKYGRVNLDRLMLIGIDCMGTYESNDYAQIARASTRNQSPTDEMLRWTRQGPIAPYRLRNACQMCEQFIPENADIAIDLVGMNVRERLMIEARDDLAENLHLPVGDVSGRDKAVARLHLIRHHRREKATTDAMQMLKDIPALLGLIAPCTACAECVESCPFCDTNAFTPKPAQEAHTDRLRDWPSGETWSARGHALGPIGDLIAWGRRAASCVQCGMCESACPRDVPLTALQSVLGRRVQEEFHYIPGRSVTEKLPWAVA
ncbi:MAG: 4Fe-4S dicluster domain-containing protein [Chloroflexi bacterium]|nr:4Fe-4S dicluster domain-containing protein [Chloroflexota bacterium]